MSQRASTSSTRSKPSTSKRGRATAGIGTVPKHPPKYLSAFFKFVADVYDGQDDAESQRALSSDRRVTTWFKKHWVPFVNKVEETRPRKKQRVEEQYTEQKLAKDAKATIAKLEQIKTHMGQVDLNEAQEQIELIHHLANHLYRRLMVPSDSKDGGNEDEAGHDDPFEDHPMEESASTIVPSPSENSDMQTTIKPEPSMTNLTGLPPPLFAPSSSVVSAPVAAPAPPS